MFPQGKIGSLHKRSIEFEKGVQKIIERTDRSQIQIIFLVNSIDYFINKKPILYHYVTEYKESDINYLSLEKNYNAFLNESIKHQTEKEV
jgi:hypothetical protein